MRPNRLFVLASLPILTVAFVVVPAATSPAEQKAAEAAHGMVVSANVLASQTGVDILKKGGNAVDAAVATGFALAVTYPGAGNIGGGGFFVIRLADGATAALDFREKAPQRASRDMYLDSAGNIIPGLSLLGHRAAGVPGSVDGLLTALAKYGTMKRADILEPAIRLARGGFPVDEPLARSIRNAMGDFRKYPAALKVFAPDGKPLQAGDTLYQRDLARTLERIAAEGRNGFYRGETADLIVAEMKRGNGLIDHEDLRSYRSVFREPICGTYRGYDIISMPPPSAGGIALIEILDILEGRKLKPADFHTASAVHYAVEAMKHAYADRAEYIGDPDAVHVPVREIISKGYAAKVLGSIRADAATPPDSIRTGSFSTHERDQTTHYSVVDKWGNAVSVTTTINGWFGSAVLVDGAGFFLNNEMDDFSSKPGVPNMFGLTGGEANAIAPGKRMLSSMTPTIVVKDGKPLLIAGSPGGSTIITTVLQVVLNVIDFKMDLEHSVAAARFHHQWRPDTVFYERSTFSPEVIRQLEAMGYHLLQRPHNGVQGLVEAIMIDPRRGRLIGVSDPRGEGAAVGY